MSEKMNPKVKARWLKALRSGKFKQGRGRLKKDGRYCCLGVLCELHRRSTHSQWRGNRYKKRIGVLPTCVAKWAGLHSSTPHVSYRGFPDSLVVINDSGKSFETIADAIERSL